MELYLQVCFSLSERSEFLAEFSSSLAPGLLCPFHMIMIPANTTHEPSTAITAIAAGVILDWLMVIEL